MPATIVPDRQLTVFYDGDCPLCRREISFYRKRQGADAVCWVDVSRSCEPEVAPGLAKASALTRFHVRDNDGRLVSGGAALAALWEALPGFHTLGRLFRLRPLGWMLERVYRMFLLIRPRLQAMATPNPTPPASDRPAWLVGDLRSDHAGETGAVAIYRGILAVSRDADIRSFAESHLKTEQQHLDLMEQVLPARDRSMFLPLWRVAGFITGAVPALFGRDTVFATIDAVETFVDLHYAEQVERLSQEGIHADLRDLLERCRLEEIDHRDEARQSASRPYGHLTRIWCRLVGAGSAAAVALARRA